MRRLAVLLLALCAAASAAAQTLAPAPAPTPVPEPPARSQRQATFALEVGDTVVFDYRSAEIPQPQGPKKPSRTVDLLDAQARWLKDRPDQKVILEAYCDDDLPPDQTAALCAARANAVRDHLVKKGVAAERIATVSFNDRFAGHVHKPATAPKVAEPAKTDPAKAEPAKTDPAKARAEKKADKLKSDDEKKRRGNRRVVTRLDG
jgi:peptidoglycan-associated lipoprotein